MMNFRKTVIATCLLMVVTALYADPRAQAVIKRMDKDGDGRISQPEWTGNPRLFELLDSDKDGYLTLGELDQAFSTLPAGETLASLLKGEHVGPMRNAAASTAGPQNEVQPFILKTPHKRAFASGGASKDELHAAGMNETGLIPVYPDDKRCFKIDHVFGEKWKGPLDTLHSGADRPAPMDEPIIAIADGVLINKSEGDGASRTSRGVTVVLQHSPADTGLPVWLYTSYSHFNKMPEAEIGTRFKMGQYLGPNGRSGVPGARREPHLHLTMYIASSPNYAIINGVVVPEQGEFIDPVAVYRGRLPMDTATMQGLQGDSRKTVISYMTVNDTVVPSDARIIWPYKCK